MSGIRLFHFGRTWFIVDMKAWKELGIDILPYIYFKVSYQTFKVLYLVVTSFNKVRTLVVTSFNKVRTLDHSLVGTQSLSL
jgi:hypothetical protein